MITTLSRDLTAALSRDLMAGLMRNLMSMQTLIVICLVSYVQSASIKGPPIPGQREIFNVGRLGEEIRLSCPMEGNPVPIIEWLKGEEQIDEYLWTRFKPNRKNLRIREATLADSGRYYCRGVNGFGSERISIDLIVIDPSEFPNLGEGELPDLAPPRLSADTITAREEFEKKMGDTFSVSCKVTGKPSPTIVWYKNGVELMDNVGYNGDSSILRVRNLMVEDSGTYTCVARNLAGDTSKDYRLTVRNTLLENPVFYNSPTNQTVNPGDTASLDCRVQSVMPPTIKWLKRLDPRDVHHDVEVFTVGRHEYKNIERRGLDPSTYNLNSDIYMSKLELVNVQPEDGGVYICFVMNTMGGFNFKPVTLTVRTSDSPLVLIISISLAGVTLFILVGLMVCLVKNKSKKPEIESGEVRSTLICPPAPPPSVQDPLYSKTGQPLPPPPTPVQWAMLYGQQNGQSSYTDSSQYGGNTYEVPRYADRTFTPTTQRSSPAGQAAPPGFMYGGYRH